MSKCLILHPEWGNFTNYMNEKMREVENIDVETPLKSKFYNGMYWKLKIPHIIIKILHDKFKLPVMKLVLSDWCKKIKKYDYVVLFNDVPCKYLLIKYIKEQKKDIKIILWFYDSIGTSNLNEKKELDNVRDLCKIYTYDYNDSKMYGINFATQFYLPDNKIDNKGKIIKYDVFYCGSDKGRLDNILSIKQRLNKLGFFSFFYIKSNENVEGVYKDGMPYKEVLKHINNCKCILEINGESQSGLTMRAMESIFYNKKLITNNVNIKTYNFYNPNNIFILGNDDNLMEFMQKKYEPVDEKIKNKYCFTNWLKNIGVHL